MNSQFRILHLEDSQTDCELVRQILAGDGLDCEILRCESRETFIRDLQQAKFDLIFADCTLPQFSGVHALELARKYAPETPFIFVSGTIEEDSAIESLRSGATDYVLKSRLSRLVPAVRRAIAETKERAKSQEMEERLLQSQRLEAVGTLAGGIAHDFNNILTIIRGYSSLLPLECAHPDRVREIAATIDRATGRGSELVSQLLAFARKSDGSFTPIGLNQSVRDVVEMLRPAMAQNVDFQMELAEDLPDIPADPGQVERVLINLVTNARDAMPEGGTITLSTSRLSGDAVPSQSGIGAEEYLCLRVTDTGSGMDEDTRQRIFEPFFTTKPRGKGTGLGMPVVYGLMQSHGGLIDVQSKLGEGTSILLYFPIAKDPLPREETRPAASPTEVNGTETVLIVDDEPDLRYFVEMILSLHGYQVLSAGDAESALALLPLASGEVHLLFSDVGLPMLDGFELIRRARAIYPEMKVILCSGYTDAQLKTRMAEVAVDGFIAKPYDAGTLLAAFRSALDAKRK